jgi:hypothetical protein
MFARFYGPSVPPSAATQAAMDKRHWTLTIDYIVGASAQAWSLQDLPAFTKGEGMPAKIATDVCAIVMGHGGTLVR